MNVCIVGARRRSESQDEKLVNDLIDQLLIKYPQLKVISTSCDRGVGKIVKSKCLPEDPEAQQEQPVERSKREPHKPVKAKFDFVEISVRTYLAGPELTKSEFASLFIARNATLNELGDEFHLFTEQEPRGMMADLLQRVRQRGAPCAVYRPGERDPKMAIVIGNTIANGGNKQYTGIV